MWWGRARAHFSGRRRGGDSSSLFFIVACLACLQSEIAGNVGRRAKGGEGEKSRAAAPRPHLPLSSSSASPVGAQEEIDAIAFYKPQPAGSYILFSEDLPASSLPPVATCVAATAAVGQQGEAMGAGGRMTAEEQHHELQKPHEAAADSLRRVPTDTPPFTLGDVKKAIPPHCFRRSVLRSFSYVLHDLAVSASLLYIALFYIPRLPSPLGVVAWPLYWAVQGCVLTGVWVIAHECGHHAFSDYPLLDDAVGMALHSALLVPYFSWKYSHRRHHSNTGSLERDEVFVPKPKAKLPWFSKYLNNPPGRFLTLSVTLTLGWPLYLAFNVSGRHYDVFACHFDPYGPIYNDRERLQIYLSDAGVLSVLYALYRLACAHSIGWVVRLYGVPLLVVNGFLVLITFLQHTHPALPHYDSGEWDWLRGALATVDRDYGVLNRVFHNITDTHVVHHLVSTMPHYHAMEATKAVRPLLGEYYRLDTTPVFKAMWREVKECVYVEPDDAAAAAAKSRGVLWYRNKF